MPDPVPRRFVILRHELPPGAPRASHFDLMLEEGGVLRTWAMDQLPRAHGRIELQPLADHRLDYLTYEGPVSGDRGTVTQVDGGTYTAESPRASQIDATFAGRQLNGKFRMHRDSEGRWWMEQIAGD